MIAAKKNRVAGLSSKAGRNDQRGTVFKTFHQRVDELALNHRLVACKKERSVTFGVDGPETSDDGCALTPIGGIIDNPI